MIGFYTKHREKKSVKKIGDKIETRTEKKKFNLHIDWVAVIIASIIALLVKLSVIPKVPW